MSDIKNEPIDISPEEVLRAFFPDDKTTVYLRVLDDKPPEAGEKGYSKNYEVDMRAFKSILPLLTKENSQNRGIFFVVNGGGQKKEAVISSKKCTAQFFEIDEDENGNPVSFEKQLEMINAFPLTPSIVIRTGKSLHTYLLTEKGDIKRFRGIQEKLISKFRSDTKIKDECRVMRLPGFYHCKNDPIKVEVIWFHPEIRYTQDEIEAVLPEIPKIKPKTAVGAAVDLFELADSEKQKKSERWLDNWLAKHGIITKKFSGEDGTIKYALLDGCPWKADHEHHATDNEFANAILMISPDGKIGFSCAHSHCANKHWKDFRKLYDPNHFLPLVTDERGNILKTRHNCEVVFNEDIFLKGRFKYNEFEDSIYLLSPLLWMSKKERSDFPKDGRAIVDSDRTNMYSYFEKEYTLSNANKIDDALLNIAKYNAYNPLTELLESLECNDDGYIQQLLPKYLGADDNAYNFEVMKLFMLGAVSRAYYPGIKFDYMPIIEGAQGIAKSYFVSALALSSNYFFDGLSKMDRSREVAEQLRGKWIIEIGELSAMRKSDIEDLKSFVGAVKDSYRPAYGRATQDYLRRCVFIGTTNNSKYLRDSTGNRRFLPIKCNLELNSPDLRIFTDEFREDVRLAWGEAVHLFKAAAAQGIEAVCTLISGLPLYVMDDALIAQGNAEEVDEWEGIIRYGLIKQLLKQTKEAPDVSSVIAVDTSPADIFCHILNGETSRLDNKSSKRINDIVRKLEGWSEHYVRTELTTGRGFRFEGSQDQIRELALQYGVKDDFEEGTGKTIDFQQRQHKPCYNATN